MLGAGFALGCLPLSEAMSLIFVSAELLKRTTLVGVSDQL